MNFIKKNFSIICLSLSLLLLFYTIYKSEFFWKGNYRDYYFLYFVLSLVLIFFSFITFFLNESTKEYLIICFISVLSTLYIFEGYLILSNDTKEIKYTKETGQKWDKRSRLEIYEDKKKTNNKVTIIAPPSIYLNDVTSIFPLSSISNSETIFCNDKGYYAIYQSDRYGFNNPDNEWDKEIIEYLLVGDSFTHGACVNRPNDIASVLRSLFKKSTLNLGYAGNGPLIEYATLREYLIPNIKKIIWIFYEENDLSGLNEREINNKILKKYLNNLKYKQNLKFRQSEINDLADLKIKKEFEKKTGAKKKDKFATLINFIKFSNTRVSFHPWEIKQIQLEPEPSNEFKEIIQLAKKLSEKNNSKFYFVYLPEYNRYKMINYNNTNYNLVKKIINDLGIPFIDIDKEVFQNEDDKFKLFPFGGNGHYNEEGYRKVAKAIHRLTN